MMSETTVTHLLAHGKDCLDAVEGGAILRVFRRGKLIAEIVPVRTRMPSWKKKVTQLVINDVSLSEEICRGRGNR